VDHFLNPRFPHHGGIDLVVLQRVQLLGRGHIEQLDLIGPNPDLSQSYCNKVIGGPFIAPNINRQFLNPKAHQGRKKILAGTDNISIHRRR
jgi:hypothetical protein